MKFKILQDNLRKVLWQRIDAGELTGLRLAEQTGFKQAHISNFLNRKRGLSIEGMDKVLSVQHLSVLDLLDPAEVNQRASILPPSADEFENVVLTTAAVAASQPLITSRHIQEILKFKQSFLKRMRAEPTGDRSQWLRVVMMKPGREDCEAMSPRLSAGSTVLLDRHYNTLTPYRRGDKTMFAVKYDNEVVVRYVHLDGTTLVLRPENASSPVKLLHLPQGTEPSDLIVGRVGFVSMEV